MIKKEFLRQRWHRIRCNTVIGLVGKYLEAVTVAGKGNINPAGGLHRVELQSGGIHAMSLHPVPDLPPLRVISDPGNEKR